MLSFNEGRGRGQSLRTMSAFLRSDSLCRRGKHSRLRGGTNAERGVPSALAFLLGGTSKKKIENHLSHVFRLINTNLCHVIIECATPIGPILGANGSNKLNLATQIIFHLIRANISSNSPTLLYSTGGGGGGGGWGTSAKIKFSGGVVTLSSLNSVAIIDLPAKDRPAKLLSAAPAASPLEYFT
jgi:hypothetical protein